MTETSVEKTAPVLDLQDIANTLNLVTIAIERGTYKRQELRNVLDVTDKLEAFLQHQIAAQTAAQKGEA